MNDADDLAQVMLRSVATAPPAITIAGNVAGMPLVFANDAFTEITRVPDDGHTGPQLLVPAGHRDRPDRHHPAQPRLHNGRHTSVVLRNYRSDGELFWNEVSISPIRDRTNQITHYTGTQIDVTGRTGRQDTANAGR